MCMCICEAWQSQSSLAARVVSVLDLSYRIELMTDGDDDNDDSTDDDW